MRDPDRVLPLSSVRRWADLARSVGVSPVATGRSGFVAAFERAGRASALPDVWRRRRLAFIRRHVAQARARGERWTDDRGRITRRALALLVWGYDPR